MPTSPGDGSGDAMHPRTPARGALTAWLWWFAVCWVLWLVMAGSVARSELLAGAGVAALAALVAVAMRDGGPPAWPGRDGMAHLARALASVPGDLARLVRVLGREVARRPSLGAFEVVRFDPAPEGDPSDDGRRSLMVAAESLSPNAYVVGVDRERGLMLVHRLVPEAPDTTPPA